MSNAGPVCFNDLSIRLDEERLWKRLRAKEGSGEIAAIQDILAQAKAVARPRGVVRCCQVRQHGAGGVMVEGEVFHSRLLRLQFEEVDRVYAFVLTVGEELEAKNLPQEDLLERFWWDEVKSAIMRAAHHSLQARMAHEFDTPETMPFVSPGSGDVGLWSVADQAGLFRLLGDVESMIGVRLSRACCMTPRHSLSGLHYPRSTNFVTCTVCRQIPCADRLARFDPKLWKRLKDSE